MALLHLGPGLGNGLCNLHNARRARSPVVVRCLPCYADCLRYCIRAWFVHVWSVACNQLLFVALPNAAVVLPQQAGDMQN